MEKSSSLNNCMHCFYFYFFLDIRKINDMALNAKNTGMIILGGGLAKHHICNANLMVRRFISIGLFKEVWVGARFFWKMANI